MECTLYTIIVWICEPSFFAPFCKNAKQIDGIANNKAPFRYNLKIHMAFEYVLLLTYYSFQKCWKSNCESFFSFLRALFDWHSKSHQRLPFHWKYGLSRDDLDLSTSYFGDLSFVLLSNGFGLGKTIFWEIIFCFLCAI